jgi:hypothetical protein
MTRKDHKRTNFKLLISFGILIATAVLTIQMIVLARQNQEMKIDLSEVNHMRYGLLNVDEWSLSISAILSQEIMEFKLSPENREKFQANLEALLNSLLDEAQQMIIERTSGELSAVKRWMAGYAIELSTLRDSIPSFASQILDELNKPETAKLVQDYLYNKLGEFNTTTYSKSSMEAVETLMEKYDCSTKEQYQELLTSTIKETDSEINNRVIGIVVLTAMGFLLFLIGKRSKHKLEPILLILFSLCLLMGGITTPMIDLEARIDLLLFQLMGHEMAFTDNIIYFQSKSITDVVRVLWQEGSIQMIFVGFLIFLFSIIFPAAKLIGSLLYTRGGETMKSNRIIRFFVFKSGKWSMADVMVVAIFMAYVGFNGIVGSELHRLSESADPVEIFTTNGTRLLGGFYLFLSFCLSSLVLSELLGIPKDQKTR